MVIAKERVVPAHGVESDCLSRFVADSQEQDKRLLCVAERVGVAALAFGRDQLLVIRPPGGQLPGAVLQVWTDLPDEAIAALGQLLYDMRNTHLAEPGSERRWCWNSTTQRWEILQLTPAMNDTITADSRDQTLPARLHRRPRG